MRNMSFSMTTEAVREHRKTVTRRLGWWDLKPGTILQAVEKAQGLKRGEHVKPICLIRVTSVFREQVAEVLYHSDRETTREGFPGMTKDGFATMFCRANRCLPTAYVNRIAFEYLP
jgi:hypothetical protein